MDNEVSMAGAAAYNSSDAPLGRLWWNWPLTRLVMDENGGRLKGNDEQVPPFFLALIAGGASRSDIRFRWEEVEKVELTRRRIAYFGNRLVSFGLVSPARARNRGIGDFDFAPLSERKEKRILDFAEAKGAKITRRG